MTEWGLAEFWAFCQDRIRSARGLAYPDIIEAAVSRERIRALWVIGTNPIVSFPNLECCGGVLRKRGFPCGAGRLSSDTYV